MKTYTEAEVAANTAPIFSLDLTGPAREWPFNSFTHMFSVTGVVGDLYLGRRTKPYRMNFYVYRWLSKCSEYNRKLLMTLRTRGLILGCDDA